MLFLEMCFLHFRYMLTQEGQEVAKECLARSGMLDPMETLAGEEDSANLDINCITDEETVQIQQIPPEFAIRSEDLSGKERSVDVPTQSLDKFLHMGYSKEQVFDAFIEVSKTSGQKDISSLLPAVLCHLREEQIYCLGSVSQTLRNDCQAESTTPIDLHGHVHPCGSQSSQMDSIRDCTNRLNACSTTSSINLRGCSSNLSSLDAPQPNMSVLRMPPLDVGERFEDAYEVLLVLDDREQFATHGSRGRKLIDAICKEHKIKIEVRRLPVGDGIWIARHKYHFDEYVLDFVVERKNVSDLRSSIRDNRYKDQKLRLKRCGLKKLIYLVEGDTNSCEGAESIKTACFSTEILDGFNIQRSTSLADTLKKYGYLTKSISECYNSQSISGETNQLGSCPLYGDFVKRCEELEKMTISDVFAIQLMQVAQVTEEVAMAVVHLHPTLLSLARAYSLLEGDLKAQEEMLQKKSNNIVSGAASRNIFQLVWSQ
ncbi:Crossover junction endonuclease MUS81 [Linum perenne]